MFSRLTHIIVVAVKQHTSRSYQIHFRQIRASACWVYIYSGRLNHVNDTGGLIELVEALVGVFGLYAYVASVTHART